MILSFNPQSLGKFTPLTRILWLTLFFLVPFVMDARGQAISARISVESLDPARVRIEGVRGDNVRSWSFRNTYASVGNLGERIENLKLMNADGAGVEVRKLAAGEYEAKEPCARFSYDVKLAPPSNVADAAYVSWLAEKRGVLMLNDLLPRVPDERKANSSDVIISFVLPVSWQIVSLENRKARDAFVVKDAARAVFFVGQNLRERQQRVGTMNFTLATNGEWAFTDEDAMRAVLDVLREHTGTNGGVPRESAMLLLSPFPRSVGASRWSAETRGGTTLLLLGQAPSRTAALTHLSVPLAHELFHLWIPNGVALDGNYDWFYEGFTQYQALRTCVRLGTLTFQDFLNAIGGAFDAYRLIADRDKFSLIEASQRRWTSAPGLIYNKGLLAAFLYDLTLRHKTGGKRSLDNVYQELFRRYHQQEARVDGNAALIKALGEANEMQSFVQQYIEHAGAIDLPSAISSFGLRIDPGGVRTRLMLIDSLNHKQRDLLRKLGYNNDSRVTSQRVELRKAK